MLRVSRVNNIMPKPRQQSVENNQWRVGLHTRSVTWQRTFEDRQHSLARVTSIPLYGNGGHGS